MGSRKPKAKEIENVRRVMNNPIDSKMLPNNNVVQAEARLGRPRATYAAWSSGLFEVARAGHVRRGLGDLRLFTVKIGVRRKR